MQSIHKTWLVRTRVGEVLGPFSQSELVEELEKKTFSTEDEIAQSGGHLWVSASSLSNRDLEEVTRTSTRATQTGSNSEEREPGTFTSGPKQLPLEELTPTPDHPPKPIAPSQEFHAPAKSFHKPRVAPMLTGFVIAVVMLMVVFQFKGKEKNTGTPSNTQIVDENESPFVRQIYTLIKSGESATALKKLTEYHEKGKKDGIDYLIPYAALLIMEGESIGRAKKFLEQVINSQSSPQLKARAHHWLGYLLLQQDEADMGESHFLESLQLNPKDAASRFNLGRAYLKQEKYSQALDYLQLAELEIPDLWLIHIYKGRAKVALGNLEEAKTAFKTAITLSPDRWISYIYYALYLLGVHEFDEARSVLRTMLTRDPQYELHAPAPLGYFQERVNYQEYLSIFTQVMDKGAPDEKELGKLYIHYLMSGGTYDDARRFSALADKSNLLAKVIALKVVMERKPNAQDLKTALARLPLSLSGFGPYGYVLRGEAQIRLGLTSDARESFTQALKLDPKSAISHWAMASLLERLQKKDEAQLEIKNLLSFHPNYIPAIVSSHHF